MRGGPGTVSVGTDDVRELASFRRTHALLREVWAFAYVLVFTVKAFLAVPEHCEIATYTLAHADPDMGERAASAIASACVREVHAERGTMRGGVVGQRAAGGGIGTRALKEGPTDRDLSRIVLIGTGQGARACSYRDNGERLD